jgi:hypothetical protein
MLIKISAAVVVDHGETGRAGGRSGGWPAVLPGCQRSLSRWGSRASARLERSPSTVRGWLRTAARRAELLHTAGLRWVRALDPAPEQAKPAGSPLRDAVEALGSAVRECRLPARDPRRTVGARRRADRWAVVRLPDGPGAPTWLVVIKRHGCRAVIFGGSMPGLARRAS